MLLLKDGRSSTGQEQSSPGRCLLAALQEGRPGTFEPGFTQFHQGSDRIQRPNTTLPGQLGIKQRVRLIKPSPSLAKTTLRNDVSSLMMWKMPVFPKHRSKNLQNMQIAGFVTNRTRAPIMSGKALRRGWQHRKPSWELKVSIEGLNTSEQAVHSFL